MNNKIYIYGNHVLKTLFESFALDVYDTKPLPESNSEYIVYNNEKLLDVFMYLLDIQFDSRNHQKNINFNNLLSWDSQMIDTFVKGLFINKTINLDSSSSANQLYHILRLFGHCININNTQLSLYDDYRFMEVNTYLNRKVTFLKVLEIKETNLTPQYVYTLGVDDDHSYNVEGLICENCFLLGTNDDLTDISTTWNSCAQISKWSGGIGLHVSNIRGKDSLIKGTGGKSNGLVPFLKVFNEIARWIDQGGRRPGSIAIYLEPHHPDIFEFLDLRKNFGAETERARDLFLALWISDLFMKQVEADGDWYLFSADECPNLTDAYGDEYEKLYYEYVNKGLYRNKVPARKIWMAILESQIETGMPYIGFKDHINRKSNQKNIGTIKSSNLCVHEDTLVLTDKGHIRIKDLENQKVNVWNGEEWSETTVRKTGTNKSLVRVILDNGSYLDCTPEHKFYMDDMTEKQASELVYGDSLVKYNLPEPIEIVDSIHNSKYDIPIYSSINNRIKWFTNFIKNGFINNDYLKIYNHNKDYLLHIKLMLQTLNIESHINCNTLNIHTNQLKDFNLTTFKRSCHKLSESTNIKVLSVEPSYQNVDTYCFTEHKRHMGMFNGILTGQCIEIAEYSDHEEYAVCNLASIALKSFVKPFNNNIDEWIIYSKPNCKYCKYAKTFFDINGIKYTEINGLENLDYFK